MRPSAVGVLLACGVIAVAGGWYFGTATTPPEQDSIPRGRLAFPDFASKLNTVTKVEITHQGSQTVIEKRPQGGWGVAQVNDYPVQQTKLRGILTALAELRLTEPRTSDPSEFSRLGVDDPNGKTSTADLLQVVDKDNKPLAVLIVGHRRTRGEASLPDQVYVRLPHENQSWLADGNLQVDADPSGWLDRSVMNIGHERIASVVVGDHALVFSRTDGKFALTEPADHPKLEDYKVDDVSRALELLSFQEVRADKDAAQSAATGHAVFTTTDGLAITADLFHADKDVWARFSAAGSGPAKAEADSLNARLSGWSYEIGDWKEKSLVPTLADLKADEQAKPTASAAPAGGAATSPAPSSTPNPAATPAAGTPLGKAPAHSGAAAK